MFSVMPTVSTRREHSKNWFLFGAVGSSLLVLYDVYFRAFYTVELGLTPANFALIMTFFAIWNAINDPIFGFISDRIKSPLGRRKPMILIGAIPFGLSFYFMFNPIVSLQGKEQWAIGLYCFIIVCLYDAFYSMVYGAWMATIPEMYRDQNDLRKFNLRRNIIMMAFTIGMTLLAPKLISIFKSYSYIGLIAGILMPVVLFLSTIGIKENPMYAHNFNTPLLQSIKLAFKNKPFLAFVSYHSLYNIGKYLLMSNIAVLVAYNIITGTIFNMNIGGLMVPVVFGTMTIMFPLWNILIKKCTKDWTNVVTLIMCCVACVIMQFTNSIIPAIIAAFIMGTAQSGYSLAHDLYNARNLDYHYAVISPGQRSEGSYAGVGAFIDRLVSMLGPWMIVAIYAIGGYVQQTDPNTGAVIVENIGEAALLAIKSVSGIGAMIFFAGAAVLAAFVYKLRGKRWSEVEQQAKALDIETHTNHEAAKAAAVEQAE